VRRLCSFPTIALVFVFLVLAAGATTYMLTSQLPSPQEADTAGLLRWMVLRDLEHEQYETQLALVDRFEKLICDWGGDPKQLTTEKPVSLTEAQKKRLASNTVLLQRVWFRSRVDQYFACPPSQRASFLDTQIKLVSCWSTIDAAIAKQAGLTENEETTEDCQKAHSAKFFAQIEQWIQEAQGQQQRRMKVMVRSAVIRWLETSDLATQPMSTRTELAKRIVCSLDEGLQVQSVEKKEPSPEHRQQLRKNSLLLMEAWFRSTAVDYARLKGAACDRYLERQVDRVTHWGILDFLCGNEDRDSKDNHKKQSQGTPSPAALQNLLVAANQWIDRAEPPIQAKMKQFLAAIQAKIIQRQIRGFFQSNG